MMYYVQKVDTSIGEQWALVREDGMLSALPCRFLKHLRAIGRSIYTQKEYAVALKFFSEFTDTLQLEYSQASMETFSEFVAWLQSPNVGFNVIPLERKAVRSARTVNTYMAAIMGFYGYLFDVGVISTDFRQKYLRKPAYAGSSPRYKDFLYHIHKYERPGQSVFHVKEPRRTINALTPEQVRKLILSASNIRDKFLLYLLFVSGMRIGEMLSLYNEDLVFDLRGGHRIELKDRGALPNGGKLKTGPRTIYVNQECLDLYDDYQYEMLERFGKDNDFLFIKIKGTRVGEAMNYSDIVSLFRRLSKKSGIHVYPHLLRHTHATMYYAKTRNAKGLQERLGHSDIQTTLNAYVHPTAEDILTDWKKASESFDLGGIL